MGEEGKWIEWAGGECPVDGATLVDVKFRGHGALLNRYAWEHDDAIKTFSCWHHSRSEPDSADIIAYRVVQS